MLKILICALACALTIVGPGAPVSTASGSDRHHEQRVQARGVISAIDYHAAQLILVVEIGDRRVRLAVQATRDTLIVDSDRTRLRFQDLTVGDHLFVAGAWRDHVVVARLIVRA